MAFKNSRFPPKISFGAVGGPAFKTEVVPVNSGVESRNQVWEVELGRWEVGHNAREPDDYGPLQAHFRIMRGRAHSFPFKDWTDFSCTTGVFVLLTSTTFQCYKRY